MSARALITVLCVVSLSGPAFATSSWVLGPQSQLQSKRLINALWSASGCDGVEMEMKRDAVVASMRCDGSQLHTLTISKKGEGRDTTVTLRGDERLAQELRKTLRRLVAESDLGWQSVRPDVVPVYEIDAEQRTRVLAERERAKARINPPTGSVNATAVTDPQRDQVLSMRSPPSLGLIMSLIGRHRGEPRLWAAAAERALGAGRVHEAGALMDVAARMKEANQTTWETQDKLLGGDGLGLYAHLGLLLFCLAVWLWLLARFKTEHSTEVQGARYGVFMTVMVAVVALMTLPEAQKAVSPAPVPQALNAPLAGGGCVADPALWTSQGWTLYAHCESQPVRFHVGLTGQVNVEAETHTALVNAARVHLQTVVAPLGLLSGRPLDTESSAKPRLLESNPMPRIFGLWLCLWGGLALLWLQLYMARELIHGLRDDRRLSLGLIALFIIMSVIHLITPDRLVMVYTGYDLTAALGGQLPTPRYGPGAVGLYGPWMAWIGVDHTTTQLLNRVMGCLSFIPLAFMTMRLAPHRRWMMGLSCAFYALLPVMWRDHTSEGIGAGVVWLVLTALGPWVGSQLNARRHAALVMSLPIVLFAMLCRPEAIAALGLGLAGFCAMERGHALRLRLALCTLGVVLLSPHLHWLSSTITRLVSETGIAQLDGSLAERVYAVLRGDNLLVHGPWLPGSVWLWALLGVGLGRSRERQVTVLLAGMGVIWMAVTAVDLPLVSIPRVHLPAFILSLPLIGLGASCLWRIKKGAWVQGLLLCITAGLAISQAEAVLAAGHNDREDTLIRQAIDLAGDEPGTCIATIDYEDPPFAGKTQRQFPHYLMGSTPFIGLSRWVREGQACQRTLFILGHRCYMAMREPDEPAPSSRAMLPICESIRARGDVRPVETRDVPNRATASFPMYPNSETLTIGLFEHRREKSP